MPLIRAAMDLDPGCRYLAEFMPDVQDSDQKIHRNKWASWVPAIRTEFQRRGIRPENLVWDNVGHLPGQVQENILLGTGSEPFGDYSLLTNEFQVWALKMRLEALKEKALKEESRSEESRSEESPSEESPSEESPSEESPSLSEESRTG